MDEDKKRGLFISLGLFVFAVAFLSGANYITVIVLALMVMFCCGYGPTLINIWSERKQKQDDLPYQRRPSPTSHHDSSMEDFINDLDDQFEEWDQ